MYNNNNGVISEGILTAKVCLSLSVCIPCVGRRTMELSDNIYLERPSRKPGDVHRYM